MLATGTRDEETVQCGDAIVDIAIHILLLVTKRIPQFGT